MALKIRSCSLCGMDEPLSMTLLDDRYWICSSHLQKPDEAKDAVPCFCDRCPRHG
jgi:hypothetical protein